VAAPVVTPFELHYKDTTYFPDMQRFQQKLLKKNYNSIPVHKLLSHFLTFGVDNDKNKEAQMLSLSPLY